MVENRSIPMGQNSQYFLYDGAKKVTQIISVELFLGHTWVDGVR
jgi:hypothetical protein